MIIFVLTIAASMIGVGLYLLSRKETFLEKSIPYLISISAGMLIGLCTTEFLPHSFEHDKSNTPLLFILGIVIVLCVEKFIAPLLNTKGSCCEPGEPTVGACITHQAACSSIGCVIICSFFDGLEIVAGYNIDEHAGFLMGTGMAFHAIPEGALAASLAVAGKLSKNLSQALVIAVGLALILGAGAGLVLSNLFDFQNLILPMATGALVYISFGHLLPVALNLRGGLVGLFLGLGSILLMSLGHHH